MLQERVEEIAGLDTILVGPTDAASIVILLHGYAMHAADLASFTHALGGRTLFVLPQALHPSPMGGYGWWHVDVESRAEALRSGPRDLAHESPAGVPAARAQLGDFLSSLTQRFKPRHLVLGGFSQGGMLACDFILHEPAVDVAGLLLLSSSRINFDAWQLRRTRFKDLPVLISHGKTDTDLSFAAGRALHDFIQSSGAQTRWIEFDAGHQIPLVVWREVRRFIRNLDAAP